MQTEIITDDTPELFGLPSTFLREMAGHVKGWVTETAAGKPDRAFRHENKIRFLSNYARARRALGPTTTAATTLARTARGIAAIVKKKFASRSAVT